MDFLNQSCAFRGLQLLTLLIYFDEHLQIQEKTEITFCLLLNDSSLMAVGVGWGRESNEMVKLIHFPALPYMGLLALKKMSFFDELLFHFSLFSAKVETPSA